MNADDSVWQIDGAAELCQRKAHSLVTVTRTLLLFDQIMRPTNCFGSTQSCTWSVRQIWMVRSRKSFWCHANISSIRSL